MNPDQMIYFVQIDLGKLGIVWVERSPADMDRKTTIADIARGEWQSDVVKILECNPVEHICSDVTEEILREAFGEGDEPTITSIERQAWAFDHAWDSRKHSEAV